MNENELATYRSELEQWANKVISLYMPLGQFLTCVGWRMVDSGLLPPGSML